MVLDALDLRCTFAPWRRWAKSTNAHSNYHLYYLFVLLYAKICLFSEAKASLNLILLLVWVRAIKQTTICSNFQRIVKFFVYVVILYITCESVCTSNTGRGRQNFGIAVGHK